MAFLQLSIHYSFKTCAHKLPGVLYQFEGSICRRNFSLNTLIRKNIKFNNLNNAKIRFASCENKKNSFTFESGLVSQFSVSEEIQFFRDCRNHYTQMGYTDSKEPYGPPLVILLPWRLDDHLLKRFIEIYGEKGFDVLTVNLTVDQIMYPCVAGGAMNAITELLEYLNDTHKYRPYLFHGFSVGAYIFGEIMAQFSDHYETYRVILNNVKGCIWDSPVDITTVKANVGKALYPKQLFKRWRCNQAVKRHFKYHHHDSVVYWMRARDHFCNPIVKVPYAFFVSYSDVLSNPSALHPVQKVLECNGVQIYQKSWCQSRHAHHFENYCYEYLYGMILFFNLVNLFPDDCGKYRSSSATPSLNNLRLSNKARELISR